MHHRYALAALLTLAPLGCKTSFLGFGTTPAEALRNASDGLTSHALRFDDVVRDTKFTNSRSLISRHALTPSRIYADTAVWNEMNDRDSSRSITIAGNFDHQRGGYTFRASPSLGTPNTLGDSRHVMRLSLGADGAYAWDTSVEHAIGALPARFAGRAIAGFLESAESSVTRDLRSESVAAFPRTARALGRLFSLDSARASSMPDGSTTVSIAIRWHSSGIRPTMPNFASYVAKYIEPSRYFIALTDVRGLTFFQVRGDRGLMRVRWRSKDGKLLPLDGGSTAMPDTLRIRMDFNTKYKVFRVGFAELVGDFIIQRREQQIGWMMRFQQEPKWQLPLFTETLIRSPLRRPFQGRGSEMYLGLDDNPGQTLLVRRVHTEVKESAIVRWLGGLGATAMSDFQGRTEAEENRFLNEAFVALRADAQEVLGGK